MVVVVVVIVVVVVVVVVFLSFKGRMRLLHKFYSRMFWLLIFLITFEELIH